MHENKRLAVFDLTRKKTKTIGVIADTPAGALVTPALMGIREIAAQRDYDIIIAYSRLHTRQQLAGASPWLDKEVVGTLTCLPTDILYHCAGQLHRDGRVLMDNAGSGYLVTDHLVKEGCQRIAIVTAGMNRTSDLHRYAGLTKALEDHHLPVYPNGLITQGDGSDGGAALTETILRMDPLPDGLFFTDDTAAAMCMQGLKDAGIRVPQDIAIVGMNDDPVTRLVTPAITSVGCPGFEMGKTAATALLDRLNGRKDRRRWKITLVPPTLIVRRSSLKHR